MKKNAKIISVQCIYAVKSWVNNAANYALLRYKIFGLKVRQWKNGQLSCVETSTTTIWTIVMSENIHNNTYGQLSCVKTSTTALMDNYHDWKHPQQHLWTIIMSENIHNNISWTIIMSETKLKIDFQKIKKLKNILAGTCNSWRTFSGYNL